jgi:hypothetical protein
MEKEGLLHHIENRRRGNCVERIVQSVALRFLIDPATPGSVSPLTLAGDDEPDPFASNTLRRAAIRTIDEVRALEEWSRVEGKRPPMLTLEAKVHLRSPAREVEFARELQQLLDEVGGRFHEPDVEGGRDFRVAITGHLVPPSMHGRGSAASKDG